MVSIHYLGDASACIADLDPDPRLYHSNTCFIRYRRRRSSAGVETRFHSRATVFRSELQRIRNKVANNLAEFVFIAIYSPVKYCGLYGANEKLNFL